MAAIPPTTEPAIMAAMLVELPEEEDWSGAEVFVAVEVVVL